VTIRKLIRLFVCLVFCALPWQPAFGAGEGPAVGTTLPSFTLSAPVSQDEVTYLGLKGAERFSLSQVAGKIVIVELINAL
jgi:hypothetical protein